MKSWCSFHKNGVLRKKLEIESEPQGEVGRSPLIYLKFSLICCPPGIERKGQEILPRSFTRSLVVPTKTLPGSPSPRENSQFPALRERSPQGTQLCHA